MKGEEKASNICLGGTFSPLHVGHMALLEEAFRRGRKVSVGLTSDYMARRSRKRSVEELHVRERRVTRVLEELSKRYDTPFTVSIIDDRFGFALRQEIDSIVVSTETESTADEIDEERARMGLPRLRRFVVDMVMDNSGERISSTRISKGEIDEKGIVLGTDPEEKPHRRTINVHLGSRNADKAQGVLNAFKRYSPIVQVHRYGVEGHPAGPVKTQVIAGARKRVDDLVSRIESKGVTHTDFFVGIEAGVVPMAGSWFMFHVCCINNGDRKGIGISSGLEIQPSILDRIMVYRGHGLEAKGVMGEKTSLIEDLSGGSFSRVVLIEEACRMALLSLTTMHRSEGV